MGTLVGAIAGAACTFPLDAHIACGDGTVSIEHGEECDPLVPGSFEDACLGTTRPEGKADCDPFTCTIVNTVEQCAVCGDGIADEDEECDGDDLDGQVCPGGVGSLGCTDTCELDRTYCKRCGNGMLDPEEECDPNLVDDPTELASRPKCADLPSPYGDTRPYTSGSAGSCREDCRWDRTGCGYCGNGQVEGGDVLVDFDGSTAVPEWCDGDAFDSSILDLELASSTCVSASDDLRPTTVTCEGCFSISYEESQDEPCCVKKGGACPDDDVPLRCCIQLDDPENRDDPCQPVFDSFGNVVELCR